MDGAAQFYVEQPLFPGAPTRVSLGVLIPEAAAAKWEGYRFDLFGLRVPNKVAAGTAPTFLLRNDHTGGILTCVQLWQQRARYQHSRLYAEVLWRPGFDEAEPGIRGGNPPYRDEERQHAERGIVLLRHLPIVSQRGKKRGDGATWPGGLPDFLDDLWTTLEKRQESTGTSWGHDPTSRAFRLDMRNIAAPRTVSAWLAKAGLRPQDIKSGTATRSNYRQFVAGRGR